MHSTKLPLNYELTINKPLVNILNPKRVCVLLSQHKGSDAISCVDVGNYVKAYDLIAKAVGAISCNIHAPISGKIVQISDFVHPYYKYCQGIIIEADNTNNEVETKLEFNLKEEFTLDEICEIAFNKGVVDTFSNNIPFHVKLLDLKPQTINYLIISFVQNEPYVHNLETITTNYLDEILTSILYLTKALLPSFVFLTVPYHMTNLIIKLDEKIVNFKKDFKNIEIIRVSDSYSQEFEPILVSTILKTNVKTLKTKYRSKYLATDAITMFHLYEALKFSKPYVETFLTVSGYGILKPSNVKVKIGTYLSDIISQCGGFCGNVNFVIMDGLMSGYSQYTLDVPIIKTNKAVTLMPTERIVVDESEKKCMRCKKCIDHCPMSLNPYKFYLIFNSKSYYEADYYNINQCIECGICSYICPVRIHLLHAIILLKKILIELKMKKENLLL